MVRRVRRLLERSAQGRGGDEEVELDDPLQDQAHAVHLRLQPARSAEADDGHVPTSPPLCAWRQGFSLHAAVTVAAGDKQGRLRLLRYGARPALSSQHLSLLADGRVRYRLRRNAGPGRCEALSLEPTDFLRRLAATLPRPYQHRTVYHGIFAPASRRSEISGAISPRAGSDGHRRAVVAATAPGARPELELSRSVTSLSLGWCQAAAALIRELWRNAELRQLCGFDPLRGMGAAPTDDAFGRFVELCVEHRDQLEQMFHRLVDELSHELPVLGRRLAVDAKGIRR